MPNAYEKALQLGLTGTDAQIVSELQSLTLNDIKSVDAADWLQENSHWQQGPSGMVGSLVSPYNASTGANRKKFDDVWGWIYVVGSSKLKTTIVSPANRTLFVINQIPSITANIRNSFYDLGGGRPYKDDTTTTYDAQRTAYNAAVAAAALAADLAADWATAQNANINPNVLNRTALVAGLRTSATQIEANL